MKSLMFPIAAIADVILPAIEVSLFLRFPTIKIKW